MKKLLLSIALATVTVCAHAGSNSGTASVNVSIADYLSVAFGSGSYLLTVSDPSVGTQNTNALSITVQSNRNYTVSAPGFSISGGLTGTPSFVTALSGTRGLSTGSLRVAVSGITLTTSQGNGHTGTCTVNITQL